MPRLQLLLIAGLTLICASFCASGYRSEAEGIRLAEQRWTPLTGPLRDNAGEEPDTGSDTQPATEPAPAAFQANTADAAALKSLTLKATLGSAATEGRAHGALGVRTFTIDADLAQGMGLGSSGGVLVTDVTRGGAGDMAELRPGDIVQRLAAKDVRSNDDFLSILRETSSGSKVDIEVLRAGEQGGEDLKRFLLAQSDNGNTGASAGLARLLYLGILLPKDDAEAARRYLKAAQGGNVQAMTNYALLAKDGIGVAKSDTDAAKWFLKAAEAGNAAAMTNLGGFYEAGRGATKDVAEAARWYRRAADAGNAIAMHRLALMYEAGRGIAKDESEAVRLLRRASDAGLSDATSKLADNYAAGRGVPKDDYEARRYNERAAGQIRKAADQGNAVAMFNLGIVYRTGKGVVPSDADGARWVALAFKKGDKYLVNELMRNPDMLALADRKWLQTVLRDEGTYKGGIDGNFGAPVRSAMEALAGKP